MTDWPSPGLTKGEQRAASLWRGLKAEVGALFLTASTVMLALDSEWAWWHLVAVILAGFGIVWTVVSHANKDLSVNHQSLAKRRGDDLRRAFTTLLRELLINLDLQTATTRISLYAHADEQFFLLSRASVNPDLSRSGRPAYPESQGVIGMTWRVGYAIVHEMPANRGKWDGLNTKQYGFDEETTRALTMQSRSFFGYRLADGSMGSEAFGVLMIEDTRANVLPEGLLEQIQQSTDVRVLTEVAGSVLAGLTAEQIRDLQHNGPSTPRHSTVPPRPLTRSKYK